MASKRPPKLVAERLIGLAKELRHPKESLILAECPVTDTSIALVATAFALFDAPAAIQVRAMVQGWDLARINRELY